MPATPVSGRPRSPADDGGTLYQGPTGAEAEASEAAEPVAIEGERTLVPGSSAGGTLVIAASAPAADYPAIPGVTITREIGRGGMGVVYEGTQGYLDRRVAVKLLAQTNLSDEFTRRFQREAKILASLTHSNVVGCYQAGIAPDGRCFLVMEYVGGPTLEKWIAEHGALPCDEAVRVAKAIASALAYAHQSGVIHRDVKPANVLLKTSDSGRVENFPFQPMLADLGLARVARGIPSGLDVTPQDLTVQGTVMGSPPNMAPEQFDAPDAVDFRTDFFALGCVLFQCLTGAQAFPQSSLTSLIARKTQGDPPDPRELRKDVPRALGELVCAMLARRREDRPASYEELLTKLEGPFEEAPAPRSRAPWLALAGGALLAGGGWLAASLLRGGDAPTDAATNDAALARVPVSDPIPGDLPDPGSSTTEEPQDDEPIDPSQAGPIADDPGETPADDGGDSPVEEPEPEPPVVVEDTPAEPELPALAPIESGEVWSLLEGSASPLDGWEMIAGKRSDWSFLDDSRNGAQLIGHTGRSVAERELPAPPWTLTGKLELVRAARAATGRLSLIIVLGDERGIELRQSIVGEEVQLVGSWSKRSEGDWIADEELADLSIGALGRADYQRVAPDHFRIEWDGDQLIVSWRLEEAGGSWSEDHAVRIVTGGAGSPRRLSLELESGSATLRDFTITGS